MKKVLITGANSYIGTSVEQWLMKTPEDFQVDTLDMVNSNWEEFDFSSYDSIFHVAGIAHFSKDENKKNIYYKVNTELTEKTAKIAKISGVKQFIFMSSIIVYGDSTKSIRIINKSTDPSPSDFYGDSKLRAEKLLQNLSDQNFKVAIIRPPMIYGKGSKGNYPRLSKLSQILPIIPNYYNERSMLYIGNFCEFVKQVILIEGSGIYFPQNKEYVSTSDLMVKIANSHGKTPLKISFFNPLIKMLFFNENIKKMFGNLIYEKQMSQYDFEYQKFDFENSIKITEN